MKKYTAIIVDDEQNIREAMAILLSQYCPEIDLCGMAASAAEARILLNNQKVEIIFLDISMPREDGFTFLRSIPSGNYSVIFATAFQEHALRAFKANAVDYLLKPINPVELKEAVAKAIYNHELRQKFAEANDIYNQSLSNLQENMRATTPVISRLTITEQSGFRIVHVEDIMYLQANNSYTILYVTGNQQIMATRTLGDFEKILEMPQFFRIHKSTIINLNFLAGYSSIQGNFAEMSDGSRHDISRRKIQEFRERIKQYTLTID